jgi:hypothetical protein
LERDDPQRRADRQPDEADAPALRPMHRSIVSRGICSTTCSNDASKFSV